MSTGLCACVHEYVLVRVRACYPRVKILRGYIYSYNLTLQKTPIHRITYDIAGSIPPLTLPSCQPYTPDWKLMQSERHPNAQDNNKDMQYRQGLCIYPYTVRSMIYDSHKPSITTGTSHVYRRDRPSQFFICTTTPSLWIIIMDPRPISYMDRQSSPCCALL